MLRCTTTVCESGSSRDFGRPCRRGFYGTNFRHAVEFSRSGRAPSPSSRPASGQPVKHYPSASLRSDPRPARFPLGRRRGTMATANALDRAPRAVTPGLRCLSGSVLGDQRNYGHWRRQIKPRCPERRATLLGRRPVFRVRPVPSGARPAALRLPTQERLARPALRSSMVVAAATADGSPCDPHAAARCAARCTVPDRPAPSRTPAGPADGPGSPAAE